MGLNPKSKHTQSKVKNIRKKLPKEAGPSLKTNPNATI